MATLIEDYYRGTSAQPSLRMNDGSIGSAVHHETFDAAPPATAGASPFMTAGQGSPRMVSMASMSSSTMANALLAKKASKTTPYDSLKTLVANKKRTSSSLWQSAPASMTMRFASVFSPSSQFLQAASTRNNEIVAQEAPFPKRRKVEETEESTSASWVPQGESDLHRACVQGNKDSIIALVAQDRVQAARAVRITTAKKIYNWGTYQLEDKQVCESYAFGLNLAIRANMDADALQILAKAAPGVLSTPDGDAQESALAVLFKSRPHDVATADEFLLQNPACASLVDRRGNSPLHIACQKGAPLDIIRRLVILYPQALFSYNACGENPLMVAQRSSHLCSEHVAAYLWEKQAEAL